MVVSSGFLDHVLTMERSDVYLRANGLISAAAQPINNTVNRQQQVQHTETQYNSFIVVAYFGLISNVFVF